MPPPTPLHASERKLGWFMATAISLTPVVMVVDIPIGAFDHVMLWLFHGVIEQWTILSQGAWPGLSLANFLHLLMVSMLVGPIFLVPWHLFHLLLPRLAPSTVALWFWSALYGLLPVSLAATEVSIQIFEARFRTPPDSRFYISNLGNLTLGLGITVLGFRAWGRRRREDRGALAADPTADSALSD